MAKTKQPNILVIFGDDIGITSRARSQARPHRTRSGLLDWVGESGGIKGDSSQRPPKLHRFCLEHPRRFGVY